LYGEFADHFRLSECKLAIIHCAGHSDIILVQTLWQEIIEKELADSRLMNCTDRMQTLSMKLVSLGKLYAGTPRYFPLDAVSQQCEQAGERFNQLTAHSAGQSNIVNLQNREEEGVSEEKEGVREV
ncbi:hypothetical protein scyTo_0023214, partial [Scyliorhinus torazame]|nr:hypothetical protein [Scyliorhinus torazame]